MKVRRAPHRWAVSATQAIALQNRLAADVIIEPYGGSPRFIAGVDAALTADGSACVAVAAVWDTTDGRLVEAHTARRPLTFPYVPGLLSFREAPAALAALRRVRAPVQVLVCDGQGRAHPRRFGLACHLGLIVDVPTIGCAKRHLIGVFGDLGAKRGSSAPLLDCDEEIGRVLRTQDGADPVYVSVGHRVDLASAERIVLACAMQHRLPEPTHQADRLVALATERGRGRS